MYTPLFFKMHLKLEMRIDFLLQNISTIWHYYQRIVIKYAIMCELCL